MEKSENNKISVKEKHEDELSAGSYAKKKLYELAVTGTGFAIGGGTAYKLTEHKPSLVFKAFSWLPLPESFRNEFKAASTSPEKLTALSTELKKPIAFLGGAVGMILSGLVLGYEHWRKVESEKIAVDEINRDISNIKIIPHSNPELERENIRLREMLEKEEKKTAQFEQQQPSSIINSKTIIADNLQNKFEHVVAHG